MKTNGFITVLLPLLLLGVVAHSSFSAELAVSPVLVAGVVLDATTGQPVADVHVLLDGGLRGTTSNADGRFHFVNVAPGEYQLRMSHVAYQLWLDEINVREGFPLRLTVDLKPAVIEAATLEWHAGLGAREIYRVERQQVLRSAAADVADVIRTMPGVQIRESGGEGSRKTVSIRGSRPDHVLVRVDGMALNDGSGEAVDLGQIPVESILSVEVSPEAAPGAPGGTVEIITTASKPLLSSGISWNANGNYSSEPDAFGVGASVQMSSERGRTSVHVRHLQTPGDFAYMNEAEEQATRVNNERKRTNGSLSHKQHLGSAWTLRSTASFDRNEQGTPGPLFAPPTTEAKIEETGGRFEVVAVRSAEKHEVEAAFRVQGKDREYESPRRQYNEEIGAWVLHSPFDVVDEDRRLEGNLRFAVPVRFFWQQAGRVAIEAGAKLERFNSENRLANDITLDVTNGAIRRSHTFSQVRLEVPLKKNSLEIGSELTLRGDLIRDGEAFRLPFDGQTDRHFSRQIRLSAGMPDGGVELHVTAGKTVAPPSFVSRFLVESVFSLGNPHLKSERIEEISAGATARWNLFGVSCVASLSSFLRDTKDLIVWRRNWRGQYYPDNLGRARAVGFEQSLQCRTEGIVKNAGGAFTLQRVQNRVTSSPYYGNSIPFQPDYFGNLFLALEPLPQATLRGELRFSGRRYTTESNLDPLSTAGGGLEPYHVFDVSLSRTVSLGQIVRATLRIGVDNVLDKEFELLDRMPMPGRVWKIQLRLNGGVEE